MDGCTKLTDLSPLAGLPLQRLSVAQNPQIKEFSALRGLPLRQLIVQGATGFSDARVLAGMPLRTLNLGECPVGDFTPLLRIPTLESLGVTASVEKLPPLRRHPGLKSIKNGANPILPAAQFWAEYDAQQAAGKK